MDAMLGYGCQDGMVVLSFLPRLLRVSDFPDHCQGHDSDIESYLPCTGAECRSLISSSTLARPGGYSGNDCNQARAFPARKTVSP